MGKDLLKVAALYATAAASTMLGFFGAGKIIQAVENRSKNKKKAEKAETNKED